MISFYDLSPNLRALFLGLIFAELCVSLVLLKPAIKRKNTIPLILLPLSIVTTFLMVVLYGADMQNSIFGYTKSPVSEWLCEQPVIYSVAVALSLLFCLLAIFLKERVYRKNTITRSSIKESLDMLSTGLCFYFESGRTVLVNNRMNGLCYSITGRDLQNANVFWNILTSGDIQSHAECLKKGDNPCYLFEDGSIWTFSQKKLENFIQLTASDITQLYIVNNQLEIKNTDLKALNMRLREYGENVVELTRSRERLETKVNIHRELGQALLATRRFLQKEVDEPPIEIWKKNVSVLRMEANLPEEDPYKMFLQAAKTIGIKIQMTGDFPEDVEIKNLFISAAVEALTNAVRHGSATTLYIDVVKQKNSFKIVFKNDGIQPTLPIKEGGGLGSLRKKVQKINGEMSISTQPEFSITLTVYKGGTYG